MPDNDVKSAGDAKPVGDAKPDNDGVLAHLLKVESEAAALVDDAQAEADKRLADGEKQNRAAYDEQYGREAAAREADYQKEIESINAQYQKQLAEYKEKLNAINADTGRFSAFVEELLAEGV
jgi:vacuolar-type H+-ATPase subunit H